MDQSSFSDLWELSTLNHQKLMNDSSHEDRDHFKIPHFSHNQSSSNVPFNSFTCSPLECRMTKIPKTVSWSSEQVRMPKEEEKQESLMINYHREGLIDWKYQKIDEQVLKKARRPYAEEHIIAERKRREKLSQRFIALASIIPGLKKADKASILGNAVNYVKELEQNLKSFEDQKAKRTVNSVVLVKNSTLEDDSSIDTNFDGVLSPPEIQVRICEKSVLVKILCENIRGVLVKVLSEIEKLHLTVTNASAMPFVGSFLDITVTAQASYYITSPMDVCCKSGIRKCTNCTQEAQVSTHKIKMYKCAEMC